MTIPFLALGLLVLGGVPLEKEVQVSTHPSSTATSEAERVTMRVGNALLAVEFKDRPPAGAGDVVRKVVVSESTPAGYWPVSQGDVVLRINGRPVARPGDVLSMWREGSGSEFELEVHRHGKMTTFTATSAEFPSLALPKTPEPPTPPPAPAPPKGTR